MVEETVILLIAAESFPAELSVFLLTDNPEEVVRRESTCSFSVRSALPQWTSRTEVVRCWHAAVN